MAVAAPIIRRDHEFTDRGLYSLNMVVNNGDCTIDDVKARVARDISSNDATRKLALAAVVIGGIAFCAIGFFGATLGITLLYGGLSLADSVSEVLFFSGLGCVQVIMFRMAYSGHKDLVSKVNFLKEFERDLQVPGFLERQREAHIQWLRDQPPT